jgi:hypothetical protein
LEGGGRTHQEERKNLERRKKQELADKNKPTNFYNNVKPTGVHRNRQKYKQSLYRNVKS